jgi:pyruvate,water dikinase
VAATPSLVLPLDAAGTLADAGGKGTNLARLARAGFAVPPGFVLTTAAYADFIDRNELADVVAGTTGGVAPGDLEALTEASAAIRHRFAACAMPDATVAALDAAYAQLDTPPVAVRSSATAEDLPGMSFAGQQESYLNVVGADALREAVVNCWSSLWTARAISYRTRHGIASDAVSIAVVVQRMVDAEAAGVLFTANPLTGARTEITIDAGLGLGEALVSGQIEPDHYVVTVEGEIVGKTLGAKAVSIRARAGGGTETHTADQADRQAIPDVVIERLATLGRRVAASFGEPQDIEWAWDGKRLFIVQSRPITSLFPLPDGLPPDPTRVLFSFGAVQGMLDPMTPLGRYAIRGLAAGAAALFGFTYTPDMQPAVCTAGERLFIDVSPLLAHPLGARVLPRVLAIIEPASAQALDAPHVRHQQRPRTATPWRAAPRFARLGLRVVPRIFWTLLRPEASRARLHRAIDRSLDEVRERVTAASTAAQRATLLEAMLAEVPPYVITTFGPRLSAGLNSLNAIRLLAAGLPGAPDPLEVTRGLPHNVTTEMDLELWQTACALKDEPGTATRFAGAAAPDLASDYRAGTLPPGAQRVIRDFLDRYGMRGVGEIDLGRARWREDPTAIMEVLRSYLAIEDPSQAPEQVFARGASAARDALARLADAAGASRGGWLKRRLVRWLGRRVRALAGLREGPKFYVIRIFGLLREALLASGRDLVDGGRLRCADDVFFLDPAELRALAAGDSRDWRALVAERRAAYERERHRKQIPRLMFGDGRAIYDGLRATADDGAFVGSPVSPGVVEGSVRVVHDPQHADLAPGEILVCRATDPGWTPLFLAAGGLIMEVGGLMTHGAVVAREYGIPAVVGVHEATTRLTTGQRVRVDGSSGRVVPEPKPPDSPADDPDV